MSARAKSRVKTLLTVFFDSKGIIHQEFLPEGQTVNSDYYLGVLNRLWARILRIRPEYREQGSWLILHDSAPPPPTIQRLYAIFWPERDHSP
jgi:hypothetical protein